MSKSKLEAVLWTWTASSPIPPIFITARGWKIVRDMGITFKKEDFMQLFGQRHDTIIKFILGDKLSRQEADALSDRKQALYRKLVAQNIIPLPEQSN